MLQTNQSKQEKKMAYAAIIGLAVLALTANMVFVPHD